MYEVSYDANTADGVGPTIRRLYYDGHDLVLEYSGTGTMLNRYVHGVSGGDDPLMSYDGSSTALGNADFLYPDRTGSIVMVANRNGGAVNANAYDEFGVPDANNTGRFQFTGQQYVPELGMYYYKARMYSPTLGRFMQTDPIGYADGMNMYAYVGNDPVNFVDPTGLQDDTPTITVPGERPENPCDGRYMCMWIPDLEDIYRRFADYQAFDLSDYMNTIVVTGTRLGVYGPTLDPEPPSIICGILDVAPGENLYVDTSAGGGLGFLFDSENSIMVEDNGRVSVTNELSFGVGVGLRGGFPSPGIDGPVSPDSVTYSEGWLAELDSGVSFGTWYRTGSLERAFGARIGAILGYGETRTQTQTLLDLGC